jgi:hypothetical protein
MIDITHLPHTVTVMKPGNTGTTTQAYTSDGDIQAFIQPVSPKQDIGIMGQWPDCTHKMYIAKADEGHTGLMVRYVYGRRTFQQMAAPEIWDGVAGMEHLKIVLAEVFH